MKTSWLAFVMFGGKLVATSLAIVATIGVLGMLVGLWVMVCALWHL